MVISVSGIASDIDVLCKSARGVTYSVVEQFFCVSCSADESVKKGPSVILKLIQIAKLV